MIHVCEKVPKTKDCPYGIRKIEETNIFEKPCVVTLIAVPNHLKEINGSLRCVANMVNPNIDDEVNTNRRIFGLGYGMFDGKSSSFSGRIPYPDEIDEFVETYMKNMFVEEEKKINVYEAMKRMRNITFLTYCNADTNILRIQNSMREFLEKYGYSNDEIDLIFCQMCVVTISSRNLTKIDNKTVLFNFADVSDTIAVDSQEMRSKLRNGISWGYDGVKFANFGTFISCVTYGNDDHALYRYTDQNDKLGKLISTVLNTSLDNALLNCNSDTLNPITYEKIGNALESTLKDIHKDKQRVKNANN